MKEEGDGGSGKRKRKKKSTHSSLNLINKIKEPKTCKLRELFYEDFTHLRPGVLQAAHPEQLSSACSAF